MFESRFFSGLTRFGEVVLLLLYVNILWVLFTLLGLVLLGFGPSTVAMFAVFRKWAIGERNFPVYVLFWKTYKQDFLKANVLGLILLLLGYILYVNLNYLLLGNMEITLFSRYLILIAMSVYGVMLIYIFPLYVHYDNKLLSYLKNSIFIAIYHPIRTIYAIFVCFILYYVFFMIPLFIFLFGASLTSLAIMSVVYQTFVKIELKLEELSKSK